MNDTLDQRTEKIYRQNSPPCDCGGPQYGTDHAPDCACILAWDEAKEEAMDQLFQEESPDETDDGIGCRFCGGPITDAEHDDNQGSCQDCGRREYESLNAD